VLDRDADRAGRRSGAGPPGNIFSTQDHAAAANCRRRVAVFAVKGESLVDLTGITPTAFSNGRTRVYSNMILDDGGDATLLLHLGSRAEKDISVLDKPDSEEATVLFASIRAKLAKDKTWYSTRLAKIKGVTEEDHHRRASPVPDARARRTEDSGDQRQ